MFPLYGLRDTTVVFNPLKQCGFVSVWMVFFFCIVSAVLTEANTFSLKSRGNFSPQTIVVSLALKQKKKIDTNDTIQPGRVLM